MFALGVEKINLAAVARSNHDVGEDLVWQDPRDFSDAVVVRIGDVKVTFWTDGQARGTIEESLRGRVPIVTISPVAFAGCSVDASQWVDVADAVQTGDKVTACGVYRQRIGIRHGSG